MHIIICFLCADESRSCLLLCARRVQVCAVLVRLLVCIVFINTSYEEKIPKHGHGEVPVAAAVRLLARGGPCGRCCCAGWLPCIAAAEPNPQPPQATSAAAADWACNWNLKQGACNCAQLQGSNTTGRRHRHTPDARETKGKQGSFSLPNFVSIDTGNAERESNQRSTRMGLNEGTEFTDTLQTRRVPRAHDKGRRLERTTKKPHSATSNKSPQQRSLLRTRAWQKICLLGAICTHNSNKMHL